MMVPGPWCSGVWTFCCAAAFACTLLTLLPWPLCSAAWVCTMLPWPWFPAACGCTLLPWSAGVLMPQLLFTYQVQRLHLPLFLTRVQVTCQQSSVGTAGMHSRCTARTSLLDFCTLVWVTCCVGGLAGHSLAQAPCRYGRFWSE